MVSAYEIHQLQRNRGTQSRRIYVVAIQVDGSWVQYDSQAAEEWGYSAEGYAEESYDHTYLQAEQNGHEPYEESQQGFRRRGRSGRGSRR